ncbi:hypothetical protein E8E15_000239 [Penicillium rubens]|nr:hypothetical protein E8E15_000239 [Penicillium rubens]
MKVASRERISIPRDLQGCESRQRQTGATIRIGQSAGALRRLHVSWKAARHGSSAVWKCISVRRSGLAFDDESGHEPTVMFIHLANLSAIPDSGGSPVAGIVLLAVEVLRPKHRPRTVWLGETANTNHLPALFPSPPSEPEPATVAAKPVLDPSAQLSTNENLAVMIRDVREDPWRTHEAIIEIFQTQKVFLGRHRRNKAELVHVQRLEQSPMVAPWRENMSQLSHSSFRTLLETYYHANDAFLVWEPVALSVTQILGSKCLTR